MTEREAIASIREYVVASPDWRSWLSVFPLSPSWNVKSAERFLDAIGPYLARRPSPHLLTQVERLELRALFEAYGKQLLNDKRTDNWKSVTEIVGITASGTGWILGWAFLEPVTIGLSVTALVRNGLEERRWKFRKKQLENIAEWIAGLVA